MGIADPRLTRKCPVCGAQMHLQQYAGRLLPEGAVW